ncbi:hypothetical protein GCK72_019273 [Caenorhabditis remanei]|uniref:G-protein coupled receptors family 1 profile domain-containing protein n=1 Tax=Caenorhabditis remanei TaxID=31234 RepID=A0A6A5GC66_CAERE|nr:hypothetical protein GCK72_019273 [Caenorhabditis remanei]KAF1752718.1 hypothetical protein GCK72_019273 [Caenorhabditis remanei]
MSKVYTYSDFEGFSNSTKDTLISLTEIIGSAWMVCFQICPALACISYVVILFHLVILCRKSMRIHSVNLIMLGISICDFAKLSYDTYAVFSILTATKCTPPLSYPFKLMDFWSPAVADVARRLGTWLTFLMAVLRFFILRSSLNPSCEGFASNFSIQGYKSILRSEYLNRQGPIVRIFNLADGLLKLIPSIMFPILTVLLIRELRRADDSLRKNSVSKKEESKSDHTTKLVIMMSITFIAAEGPYGVVYFFQGVVTEPRGLVDMSSDLLRIFEVFMIINATSHCLVCFAVSSQYRRTVKDLFCCVKEPTIMRSSASRSALGGDNVIKVVSKMEK